MARRRLGGALLAVLVLWPLLHAAQVAPGALLDPANLRVIGGFLAGFLPPETGPEFRVYLAARDTGDAWPLPLQACCSPGCWPCRWPMWPAAPGANGAHRTRWSAGLLTILRSIPELVWRCCSMRACWAWAGCRCAGAGADLWRHAGQVYAEILDPPTLASTGAERRQPPHRHPLWPAAPGLRRAMATVYR